MAQLEYYLCHGNILGHISFGAFDSRLKKCLFSSTFRNKWEFGVQGNVGGRVLLFNENKQKEFQELSVRKKLEHLAGGLKK